jgi:hypothetical protein
VIFGKRKPGWEKSRGEMPGTTAIRCARRGQRRRQAPAVRKAGHRRGRAEPPPLRAGARRGLPAAKSAPPIRSARGTRRNDRARWRACGRPTATSTRANPKPWLDPAKLKSRHLRGSGRRPLPEAPPVIVDVSRNLRAPSASLRDPPGSATPPLDRTRRTRVAADHA